MKKKMQQEEEAPAYEGNVPEPTMGTTKAISCAWMACKKEYSAGVIKAISWAQLRPVGGQRGRIGPRTGLETTGVLAL